MELKYSSNKLASIKSKFPDNYQVQEFLGEGGFGQVVECLKMDTGETVAVKIPGTAFNLNKEYNTLKGFNSAQLDKYNIIKFIEPLTLKDNKLALVCEKLDITLIEYIIENRGHAPLDLHEIRSIIQQMATALKALKDRGIIHSDIKGDNIMLVDSETKPIRVKLIDFGLAFPIDTAITGALYQTEMFRAPEVHLGLPISEAIDMWSLGIIMALMMLGFGFNQGRSRFDKIRRIVEMLGMPPDHLLESGCYTKNYFVKTVSGSWRLKTPGEYWGNRHYVEDTCLYPFSSLDELETFSLPNLNAVHHTEKMECIDLLKEMLCLDPDQRITPDGVLNHPFIKRGRVKRRPDSWQQPGTSKREDPLPDETEDQGTKEPEEPGAKEPEEPGAKEAEEPGAKEAEEPGAKEAEEPGAKEAEEPGAMEPEEPGAKEPEEPGAKEAEEPGAKEPEEPGAKEAEEPGAKEAEEPGAMEPEEPGAKEDQGTKKAYKSKKICLGNGCGTPSPRVVLVEPAPPDHYYILEVDDKEQSKFCSDAGCGSYSSSLHFIMVKSAPPDRCYELYEDDEEQSEYLSFTTQDNTSENSSAEYSGSDEGCCPVGLFFAKSCNSELSSTTTDDTDTEQMWTKKKKKKNCVKRFFKWIKKTFCSCVSANDDD